MAATRASGTNAVRYGTMRENVVSLAVVLADGALIRTGSRARKSSAGLDLTRLFVGSAGTLGIITEVTLRLYGIPETVQAGICAFPSIRAAVATVIGLVQTAIPVARAELMDALSMRAAQSSSGLSVAPAPTLFLELHGSPAAVAEQAAEVQALAEEHGGEGPRWVTEPAERERLWRARHDIWFAILRQRPGAEGWPTDVCVPISRLGECIEATLRDLEGCPLPVAMLGHVGDGNFHLLLPVEPGRAEDLAIAERINDRLVGRALSMEGTCTGEHGIGYVKIAYMHAEHGPAVGVMQRIKQALDPAGIMNPGKMLPNFGNQGDWIRPSADQPASR